MPNYLRAIRADDQTDAGPIKFIASTEGIKRDGKSLAADHWELDNYRKNPVFLWAHDYFGSRLPIGRSDVEVDDKQLIANVTFDQEDEFARQVEGKYRRGFLNTVSVGWSDVQRDRDVFYELLDISGVPVPGDPDALMERQYRALQHLFNSNTLTSVEDTTNMSIRLSDAGVWEGAAHVMCALFNPDSALEDGDRLAVYLAIERVYKRLKRVAPEFRQLDELRLLSEDEITAMFLENEFRAGAVLNSRNRADLTQAQALIQKVLDSAKKEDESKDDKADDGRNQLEAIMRLLPEVKRNANQDS